jgi:hypothetical protein
MPVAPGKTMSPANEDVQPSPAATLVVSFHTAYDRFVDPKTLKTLVFGRLTAWQNWIFTRPNASGPDGALRRFGTGRKGDYDYRRL